MLTYLVVLLDDSSVSYCHYENGCKERHLIDLDILKHGIIWAMKENLNIQFVYPDYQLPEEYRNTIEMVDHTKIGPIACGENLDVIVLDDLQVQSQTDGCYLWRCTLQELIDNKERLVSILSCATRLNVVLTDIIKWKQSEFDSYKDILDDLVDQTVELYQHGKRAQLNLLTDRLLLSSMNNCNAGDTTVVLAPDGKFYVCPAHYPNESVGSLHEGLHIPNRQLYNLDHAPICRHCDAFQCKRCIWLNQQTTTDCNIPSHEQCVVAHLERNASRTMQQRLKEKDIVVENSQVIPEIDCLDPFEKYNRWK